MFLRKKGASSLDLGFFFSNYLSKRTTFSQLSLKFFFGHGFWFDHVHEQIKVYRSDHFINVSNLIEKFESSQYKHYYFFSLFFFRKIFRFKSKALLSKRMRRKRRLRNRRSTFMLMRKNFK